MPPTGTPGDFDPVVRRLIAAKARQLVGRLGLRAQDRADVEQDLAARLVTPLAKYDPSRAPSGAFAALVVGQAVANLLRDRRAQKRTPPPRRPASAEDVSDLPDADDSDGVDLALDLASVVARLSPGLRTVAEALAADTPSEVSRRTGVPRTALYGRMTDLRAVFERAGLRDYL
jgi:RNA polymerase sigma-70 factor, ECF subfamily